MRAPARRAPQLLTTHHRSAPAIALAIALLTLTASPVARANVLVESASAAGDSITRAFDARVSDCTFSDQPARSYATGDTHGMNFCAAGAEDIFSHAERLECAKGGDIAIFNDAETGAHIAGFQAQASMIRSRFATAPAPHYVTVFLGHNDACTNVLDRAGNSCSGDRDPNNYCRTTAAAFEREFRRGLDELIQIPSTRVAVLALTRISELCNFRDKDACSSPFVTADTGVPPAGARPVEARPVAPGGGSTAGLINLTCGDLWSSTGLLEGVFGSGGVCASLTSDCSAQRRIDMYETLVGYNEVLERVTAEYLAVPAGSTSATGAVKAPDVALRFIAAPFQYRLAEVDLSCCDCFHPSTVGQRKLAEFTWNDLICSDATPCCAVSADPLENARCSLTDTTTVYAGGFWAGDVICGNDVVDPGETCDDGNATGGDGCSATCTVEGESTPSPTATPSGGTPQPGTPTRTPATPVAGCAGDCSGDGTVTVDELVLAVNVALGLDTADRCAPADVDADGRVTIEELIAAVNSLLLACA